MADSGRRNTPPSDGSREWTIARAASAACTAALAVAALAESEWVGKTAMVVAAASLAVLIFQGVRAEKRLRDTIRAFEKSDERRRRLIAALPGGVVFAEGDKFEINATVERITGYTGAELATRRDWRRFVLNEDSNGQESRARMDSQSAPLRLPLRRKDGHRRWVEVASSSEGPTQVWLIHDVTEEKRLEDRLQLTRLAVEKAADLMYLVSESGMILDCNRAFADRLGYPREKVLTMSVRDVLRMPDVAPRGEGGGPGSGAYSFDVYYETAVAERFPAELNINWVTHEERRFCYHIARDVTDRVRAETLARERELQLVALGDNLPGGVIFQLATAGTDDIVVTRVSAGVEALYGLKPAEVLGSLSVIAARVHEEDRADLTAALWASARDLTVYDREYRRRMPSGEVRWSHARAAPRRLDDGRVAWDGLEIDVTERRRAEAALLRSETRSRYLAGQLQRITDAVPGTVFEYQRRPDHSDAMLYVSAGSQSLLGIAPAELCADASRFRAAVAADDLPALDAKLAASARDLSPWQHDFRVARHGATAWVHGSAIPERQADGGVIWHGVLQDISDLKRAEESLRRREAEAARLALIVSRTTTGVVLTDAGGLIEWANLAFTRMTGYSLDECRGRKPGELLQGADTDTATVDFMHRVMARREGFRVEILNYQRSGLPYWVDLEVQPLIDDAGTVTGFMGLQTDVTARRRAERALAEAKEAAEAANRSKSDFLAAMSHEIRNPLNGILGMTDLVLGTALTARQREYLRMVRSSSEALMTVINDILDFSKIEAGKLDLVCEPFDPREAVAVVFDLLAPRAHERGLDTVLDIDPAVPVRVTGDASRLRQVALNLLGNAIKFTPRGEVVLRLAPGDGRETVVVEVTDTGIGIAAEKLGGIFDAFDQGDASTSRRFGGTGLGLSISRRLAALMGGSLTVESELGRGSCFRLEVPAAGAVAAGPETPLAGRRVLALVAGESSAGVLLRDLSAAGATARVVSDSVRALAALADPPPGGWDGIVLDADDADLRDLALLRTAPQAAGVPAVVRTPAAVDPDASLLARLGPVVRLVRPVRPAALVGALAAEPGRADEPRRPSSHTGLRPRPTRALRVLLAEDNPVNQLLARTHLESAGFSVTVAEHGAAAMRALESQSFDIGLFDIQMPELDGFGLIAAVRAREATVGPRLPAIALTAGAIKGDRERCLDAGYDAYLTKPVRFPDLFAAIETLVGDPAAARPEVPAAPETETGPVAPAGPVDREAVLSHFGGNVDLLREVTNVFLDNCARWLRTLSDAVERKDFRRVFLTAHAVKGAVGNFSRGPIIDTAVELESLANAEDALGVRLGLAALMPQLSEVRDALTDMLQSLPPS